MIFCNLGSGSKGNSTYVQGSGPALLVDQGFSVKNLLLRMESVGLNAAEVGAILLTHEHSDHLRGIGIFARRFHVPVFMTALTYNAVPRALLKNVDVMQYMAGDELSINDLKVKTFHIPHDAADPVAVVVTGENRRVGIITDVGNEVKYLREYLHDLDLLFLESNHDIVMLDNGPYPLGLIKRIKSRVGHLSNEQALTLFKTLPLDGRLRHLILGHLSEQNNDPKIIRKVFQKTVQKIAPKVQLDIASQNIAGPLFEL